MAIASTTHRSLLSRLFGESNDLYGPHTRRFAYQFSAGMNALYQAHCLRLDRIASVVTFADKQTLGTTVTELAAGPTSQV